MFQRLDSVIIIKFSTSFQIHNTTVFDGFQGRLPVRWMAIESLNYSVYTTKSDVYVHSSAPTHFNC